MAKKGIAKFDFAAIASDIQDLAGKQIFFVGGVVKSGTSWVQHLLNLHPQVSCGGESHFIDSLFPRLKTALEEHNQHILDRAQNAFRYEVGEEPTIYGRDELLHLLSTAILLLMRAEARGKPALAIGEKTPSNLESFVMLGGLIPGSKCVQIVRDPRDAAISAWYHNWRMNPPEANKTAPTLAQFVMGFTERWADSVGRGLEFAAAHPDRYLDIRYRDLLAEPGPTLARLCRFLGVDDGESVVRGCVEAASFERLSGGRPRGQENLGSFFRKGVTGDWTNYLDAETQAHVIEKAGPLMARYGFR
ncbi:MAG TPA: sulfotransferase [Stellaceae bacterium]|nr:sulfotransferase [Stellaceae bacterium]